MQHQYALAPAMHVDSLTLISHRNCSGEGNNSQIQMRVLPAHHTIAQKLQKKSWQISTVSTANKHLAVCKNTAAFLVLSALTSVAGTQQRCIAAFSSREKGSQEETRKAHSPNSALCMNWEEQIRKRGLLL